MASVVVDSEHETDQAEGQRAEQHGSKPHVLGTREPGQILFLVWVITAKIVAATQGLLGDKPWTLA
jgi:hypothetical protein